MSVLTIRAHRRYAVRMPATLKRKGCKPAKCLMVELSIEGARLSNLSHASFFEGDEVTLLSECGRELRCLIRWAHDGLAGVKLLDALHLPELARIIESQRQAAFETLQYGT